ncbi:hypothetical protein [Nostoc sp. C052]|nr:hypothetical protein [Nostoc sp. C052]
MSYLRSFHLLKADRLLVVLLAIAKTPEIEMNRFRLQVVAIA